MRLIAIFSFVLFFLVFSSNKSLGQDSLLISSDTIKIKEIRPKSKKYFDPDRAALLSAVLPGMGQLYNRQYWKVPIVLGGVGVCYYFIKRNSRQYTSYRNAVINNVNPSANLWVDPAIQERIDALPDASVARSLENAERQSRRQRDFTIILSAAAYGIVIVDAYVDAHLKAFKISKDLSFKTKPSAESSYFAGPAYGVAFNFSFN